MSAGWERGRGGEEERERGLVDRRKTHMSDPRSNLTQELSIDARTLVLADVDVGSADELLEHLHGPGLQGEAAGGQRRKLEGR